MSDRTQITLLKHTWEIFLLYKTKREKSKEVEFKIEQ